jgi:carbamoylphosphate synthase large subunit
MPKRTDIDTILIIGAGPIVIGQACEFDYSGTQACKALKAEGYRIVLVNSNPATIMTDPDLADATYIEPITPDVVTKIIEKERPKSNGGFALLPTMGGQTALNTALSLKRMGTLDQYDVEMIGADDKAIDKAEDRKLFREAMRKIGLATPKSVLANASDVKNDDKLKYRASIEQIEARGTNPEQIAKAKEEFKRNWRAEEPERRKRYQEKALIEALEALQVVGLPAIIRPSFTLGGTGGGIAYNKAEFIEIIERGLDASPTSEVLIEESVLGWKELRWRSSVTPRTTASLSAPSRTSTRWAFIPATPSPWHRPDADRQGIPGDAQRLDRGAARDRRRNRRLERPVRDQSGKRTSGGHRDEPARLAIIRPRLQGNRFSHRQDRGQTCGWLHTGRA